MTGPQPWGVSVPRLTRVKFKSGGELVPLRRAPQPDFVVIERLESALAKARSGEWRAVAIVGVSADGKEVSTGFAGHDVGYFHPMISGTVSLQHRLESGE